MKRKYDKIMEDNKYNNIWKEYENGSLVYLKLIPIDWSFKTGSPLNFEEEKNFNKFWHTISFITFDSFKNYINDYIECDDIINIISCYISAYDKLRERIETLDLDDPYKHTCVCCLKQSEESPHYQEFPLNGIEIHCDRCESWFCTPCWIDGSVPNANLRRVKYTKGLHKLSSHDKKVYHPYLIVHYTQCPSCLSGINR